MTAGITGHAETSDREGQTCETYRFSRLAITHRLKPPQERQAKIDLGIPSLELL